jgi:very-short-patch-repair endonuclease
MEVKIMRKVKPYLLRNARTLRKFGTDAERRLWQRLRNRQINGYKFCRQAPVGNYIVDFLCKEKKLIVELDGSQHNLQKEYDQRRTQYLVSQGYSVIRYWNNEVLQEGEAVLDDILRQLEIHS